MSDRGKITKDHYFTFRFYLYVTELEKEMPKSERHTNEKQVQN